jgi:hypothetical protein
LQYNGEYSFREWAPAALACRDHVYLCHES